MGVPPVGVKPELAAARGLNKLSWRCRSAVVPFDWMSAMMPITRS